MSDGIMEITEDNFQRNVLESDVPVLVDFWAAWCAPCNMLTPIVEEIASDYEGKLSVGKVDADVHPGLTQKYSVMGLPTLLLFKAGEPVERITGYQPKGKIVKQIEQFTT